MTRFVSCFTISLESSKLGPCTTEISNASPSLAKVSKYTNSLRGLCHNSIPNNLPSVGAWSSTMSFQNQELPHQNLMAFSKWALKVRLIFQAKK